MVNGKTGSRPLVLIDSIPNLKDYLDHEHPQSGNPNAILLSGYKKSFGRAIGIQALENLYKRYEKELFPKLLESPNVLPEDKPKIRKLLKKPWNPYILRHSSLTEKSKVLGVGNDICHFLELLLLPLLVPLIVALHTA
jgi:hypothetical protein